MHENECMNIYLKTQSQQTQATQGAKRNWKPLHLVDAKRRKLCASNLFMIDVGFGSHWLRRWRQPRSQGPLFSYLEKESELRWRSWGGVSFAKQSQSKVRQNQIKTCLLWIVTENHTTARMQKARTLSLDIYLTKFKKKVRWRCMTMNSQLHHE